MVIVLQVEVIAHTERMLTAAKTTATIAAEIFLLDDFVFFTSLQLDRKHAKNVIEERYSKALWKYLIDNLC